MASIFTRIIQGEIPCYKIAESEKFFAFLDINPLARGHTLVIPKKETDYYFDLEDDLLAEMPLPWSIGTRWPAFSTMMAKATWGSSAGAKHMNQA